MTTPTPSPAPSSFGDTDSLRVVLFGMPDAGKSSLLGALSQASQTQERALAGRLIDITNGLADLQRRVYDERPRETLDEIVPYPIRYEPLGVGKSAPSASMKISLIDCDGRAANEILTRPGLIHDPKAGGLAEAVVDADALILVVDASAAAEQIDSDLGEFVKFLRRLERLRAKSSEIAGLPVYLVLSKCDLLAKSGDTATAWAENIEDRKAQVGGRFKYFLSENEAAEGGFGDIDLRLWATAVRRPALAGQAARPRDPYQVAELFNQCFAVAGDFRRRERGSQRRLMLTVAGTTMLVGLMLVLAVVLYFTRESVQTSPLTSAVESYRAREGQTASARLAEPLQRKMSELTEIRQNPEFGKLTTELRGYVEQRLAELTAYAEYRDRLARIRPPSDARTEDDLATLERQLGKELVPPEPHAAEWKQTDTVLLREKWLEDVTALRTAVTRLAEWYNELRHDADKLMLFTDRSGGAVALPWNDWHDRAEKLFAKADEPPFRATDRLPQSRPLASARAPSLTYATAYSFLPVEDARRLWERSRAKLERIRDLTLALGMAGDASEERAPLKIPEAARFREGAARDRLARLKKAYPRFADWSLAELPDVVIPEVRASAMSSYRNLIDVGRAAVAKEMMQHCPDGKETHGRWLAVADWLPTAPELRDWRQLAVILGRLADAKGGDPVAALAAFLREKSFDLDVRTLHLVLPDDLKDQRLRPPGKLTIYHRSNDVQKELTFRLDGEAVRDAKRRVATYTFVPESGTALTFRPGDGIWADVLLRDDTSRDWRMTWIASRTETYKFERLTAEPYIIREGMAGAVNAPAEGTRLEILPENGVPRVPDLMPYVRLR
jgi:GTPase SAR1 family protein